MTNYYHLNQRLHCTT